MDALVPPGVARRGVLPLCLLACALLGGCVGTAEVVGPGPDGLIAAGPGPMPAPLAERVPPRPRETEKLVWAPGHYLQDQVGYTWHPGHYVAQPARHLRFVHGHWNRRGAGWVWAPGRWA